MSHQTPFIISRVSPCVAVSLLLFLLVAAVAPLTAVAEDSGGWFGARSDDPLISLAVTPVEIHIEAPTPLTGNNPALLLALSGTDGGLGALREKARGEFRQYLDQQVQMRFGEFFKDERVHLVDGGAPLTLHTDFNIVIRQKILDIFSNKDYDLEKGTMRAYGRFHYRLVGTNAGAPALREGTVNIADLDLRSRYRTRAPKDAGVVEDTTREATEELLAEIAEEVLDQVEDALEADALLELARR
ncbi:hypothetical protein [uncultured Microbulbifer sp.]|uniref:hypothetical protein n=1 Tax=uncultured Microbulbifer sp. TaxID=348147 RepID=UPI0025D3B409|nr:hypothetical protein [uncultured Microbulbifer sp.]